MVFPFESQTYEANKHKKTVICTNDTMPLEHYIITKSHHISNHIDILGVL